MLITSKLHCLQDTKSYSADIRDMFRSGNYEREKSREEISIRSGKSPFSQYDGKSEPKIYADMPSTLKREEISFSDESENYCICFVDIVGSTQLTARIYKSDKIARFYSIFINSMARIIEQHSGRVMKTVGDGVISYFPATSNSDRLEPFAQVLDCCLSMISSRFKINLKLMDEKLPAISYRVSADYGRVEFAKSEGSTLYDLFGPTVNFCAKINKKAPPNGIVIGSDLHTTLSSHPELIQSYQFQETGGMRIETGKRSYPVYRLLEKMEHGERFSPTSSVWNFLKEKGKFSSSPKPLTILLVDDDPSILFLFTEYLKSEGMIVDSFTDPSEALEHYMKSNMSRYDLVITDIRMRKLNGFELYYRFKDLNPNVKVLFVTALDLVEEASSLMPDVNSSQFLTKPIDREELINSVWRQTGLKRKIKD
jgi:class 3 adenylate cyclase/CheY-like chemotaxis protein